MKYIKIIEEIEKLKKEIKNFDIGKSVLGESIVCFHLGNTDGKQIVVEGGIHAREYISTLFILEAINNLKNFKLNGGIYFIPMMNPDGIRLVLDGVNFIKDEKLKSFLLLVNESEDFSQWKANINGVDLNVNYDVFWGQGAQNTKKLSKANFIGYYPNSEIENINFLKFVEQNKIDGSLSFHSKGEVIYYGFKMSGKRLKEERKIVKRLCELNGYLPIKTKNSTGGLSDYLSYYYKIPAFTIELGNDFLKHPISEKYLMDIYDKNKFVISTFLNCL